MSTHQATRGVRQKLVSCRIDDLVSENFDSRILQPTQSRELASRRVGDLVSEENSDSPIPQVPNSPNSSAAWREAGQRQYREYSFGSRFLGVRRSLKNWQSGHQASGLKLVPASGSTSRCPQHSGPSSGGRRQRHDLNLTTAADDSGVSAVGLSGGAGETLSDIPPHSKRTPTDFSMFAHA